MSVGTCLSCILFSIQSLTPAHEMMLFVFGRRDLFAVKSFWKPPHRYSQRYVSMVILNLLKLTVRIHHSLKGFEEQFPRSRGLVFGSCENDLTDSSRGEPKRLTA